MTIETTTKLPLTEMENMAKEFPLSIQAYVKTARHIEDTTQCMITLPCRNKDKKLYVLIAEV
jgi:hypothetical protein